MDLLHIAVAYLSFWNLIEAEIDCFDGITTTDGRCIKNIPYGRRSECHSTGGYLATINDEFTMKMLHKKIILQWNITSAFIGLRKLTGNGTYSDYRFEDGRPLSFTAWSLKSEPDGFEAEKCVIILVEPHDLSLVWHDVSCEYTSSILCQWEPDTTKRRGIAPKFRKEMESNNTSTNKVHRVGLFFCGSGEAVFAAHVCDDIPHCDDGSDEKACESTQDGCRDDQFRCEDGTCISASLYCDYRADCPDVSDETMCEHLPCSENQWVCNNGECVEMEEICDNKFDCVDQSDESSVTCTNCKRSDMLDRCFNGMCIKQSRLCDGIPDCADSDLSDETGYLCSASKETEFSCTSHVEGSAKLQKSYYIDLGHQEYGKSLVECRRTNDTIVTVWSPPKQDPYFPNPIVGTEMKEVEYESQSLIKHLISISSRCWQWVRVLCMYEEKEMNADLLLASSKENFTTTKCPKKSCLCKSGYVSCLYSSYCECQNDPTTLQPEMCHDSWTLVDDTDKLPITKIGLNSGLGKVQVSSLYCEEDPTKLPSEYKDSKFHCKNGAYIYARYLCLLHINPTGDPYGCRDLSHLESCEKMVCPADYVKCPNSYCIHTRHLCDGINHCPNAEDELECDNYLCPGYYRCRSSKSCIPLEMVCDSVRQCPIGDDEWNCGFKCPDMCTCKGLTVTCDALPRNSSLSHNTRALVIRNKWITLKDGDLSGYKMLVNLILSECGIEDIGKKRFSQLRNLAYLDLSNNNIRHISSFAFDGLLKVTSLNLNGNNLIEYLEPFAFWGLASLMKLEITSTKLEILSSNSLEGLESLKLLNISNNRIRILEDGALQNHSHLEILDIRFNAYIPPKEDMFEGLNALKYMYSSQFTHCCVRPESIEMSNCYAPNDAISSCDDLINDKFLRISLWIIGLSAFLGNIVAILSRLYFKREKKYLHFEIYLNNLGLSDTLMGLYLLTIGGMDMYFRDTYVWNEYTWRYSLLCNLLGVIATTSCEASVFFIFIITIDRLFAVKYPFTAWRRNPSYPYVTSFLIWVISFTIAVIPVLYTTYFQNEFYSTSGVCIALPLTTNDPIGWEYSVAIFIVLNFVIFVAVALGQICIYTEIKRTSAAIQDQRQSRDRNVAMQLILIVMTDFFCWFPIGIMGFLTLGGVPSHDQMYAWIVVFVLPANSALNPFLYTFKSLWREQCHRLKTARNSSTSSSGRPVTLNNLISLMQSDLFKPENGSNTLDSFLVKRQPTLTEVVLLARQISKALQSLHDNAMVYSVRISEKHITLGKHDVSSKLIHVPRDTL